MRAPPRWESGEVVLMRHVVHGRVIHALPMTVVGDDSEALATWIAPRTPMIYPRALSPDNRLLPPEQWGRERREWRGDGCLDLTPAGRAHMIRHFWDDHGSFRGWYVNLQAPIRRRRDGFETLDHALDLWVEAGGAVHWKDEDHLEQAVEVGLFTREEADDVRREAERVLSESPFPTGWEQWRPDPAWATPELSAHWASR